MIKNKIHPINSLSIFLYTIAGICLVYFLVFAIGSAVAATSDVTRWYLSETELNEGEIVAIQSDRGEYVESASSSTDNRLLGVVVPEDQALISIDENEEKAQIAIAGRAQAKVSLANGPIGRGDLIGVSSEQGIGEKARSGQPVVGVAESSFGIENEEPSNQTGLIPILVSVGVAPALTGDPSNGATWLRSIAGNDVSALQLTFVLFIAAVGLTAIIVLTYSSIRSGVVAVGRNPLAKPAILGALSQAMVMVSVIAISSFSLMYFILRI